MCGAAIHRRLLLVPVFASLILSGCSLGPNFMRPSAWFPESWFGGAPAGRQISQPAAEPIRPDWWASFDDPQLTALENRVAAQNLDVRTATVRLAESRAQRRITAAAAFPQVNGGASYQRQRPSEKGAFSLFGGGAAGGASPTPGVPASGLSLRSFDLYQYGFDASWELDFWGRVRRSVEAADAAVEASDEIRRNTLLTMLAEVARAYIQLRGTQTQLRISRENLQIAQESLALTRQRAAGGVTSQLDVENAAAQVATTAAAIPQLEQQQAELINELGFLLGEPPRALAAELVRPRPIPPVPPRVPIGLPSELARRRPDIRAAEAQLHSQTALIGVAEADFYPNITLSGSLNLQAIRFADLGSWAAHTYSIGPTLTLPIFEGGRLRGNLELTTAQQQEAAIAYQRTVLGAWQEVDDALTAYAQEQDRSLRLTQAVDRNQRALGLARDQYSRGVVGFLEVLTAEQRLLAAAQQAAASTTTISGNLVSLYKALGGGWETAFPRQAQALAAPGR
jgi:NodT family efflux transporter outer membrane factor (OMF) lipoprotein